MAARCGGTPSARRGPFAIPARRPGATAMNCFVGGGRWARRRARRVAQAVVEVSTTDRARRAGRAVVAGGCAPARRGLLHPVRLWSSSASRRASNMLPYLRGDGRLYEMKHTFDMPNGPMVGQRMQTQHEGGRSTRPRTEWKSCGPIALHLSRHRHLPVPQLLHPDGR
jgi:hypothetical protein